MPRRPSGAEEPNRNEFPIESLDEFKQLEEAVSWEEYDHRKIFKPLCLMQGTKNQKLKVERWHCKSKHKNRKGLVYVLVPDGRIFKIGQTASTFSGRLGSYNSGKREYRDGKGTNSTANYFVLQSLLKMSVDVEVWAFFPPEKIWCLEEDLPELNLNGYRTLFPLHESEPFPSAKTVEGLLLKRFRERYGFLPVGCSQG